MSAPGTATVPVDARAGAKGTRIDLDDVCRHFNVGDTVVKALDQVNLHVDEAAFVVVLGASGSGKTTLLNLIGALDAPTAGTVRLAGVELTTASRARRTRIAHRRGSCSSRASSRRVSSSRRYGKRATPLSTRR